MPRFTKETEIAATPDRVFAWHERPDALLKLTPPWESVEVLGSTDGLHVGSRVTLKVFVGPFPVTWIAEHTEYDPPLLFADQQIEGPFASWHHRHIFDATPDGTTLMRDEIDYELPFSWLGELIGGDLVVSKLRRMFDHRHGVVAREFNT